MRQNNLMNATLYVAFELSLFVLPTNAAADDLLSFGEAAKAASDEALGELRGGLSITPDFTASFGITRTISVNGDVVATQGLMLRDLGNLFKGGMPTFEQLGKALTIVQVGPNNYAANQPTAASIGGAGSVNTNSSANSGGSPTVSQPQAASNVAGGGNGSSSGSAGSFVVPGAASAGIAGTFSNAFAAGIQNSLNDVRISTRTTIDAQIGSMGLFRSNLTSSLLRDNLVGSGVR